LFLFPYFYWLAYFCE